jgi:hypothetical protein
MVVKGGMSGDYRGTSGANRAGCLGAVLGTPPTLFMLFSNFMADFDMPSRSLLFEVLLPALIVGIMLFFGIRALFIMLRRNGS